MRSASCKSGSVNSLRSSEDVTVEIFCVREGEPQSDDMENLFSLSCAAHLQSVIFHTDRVVLELIVVLEEAAFL